MEGHDEHGCKPYPTLISKMLVLVRDGELFSIVGDETFKKHFGAYFPKNSNLNLYIQGKGYKPLSPHSSSPSEINSSSTYTPQTKLR